MDKIAFTDKAPVFHQRLIRALESQPSAAKKLQEVRTAGREKGWNN